MYKCRPMLIVNPDVFVRKPSRSLRSVTRAVGVWWPSCPSWDRLRGRVKWRGVSFIISTGRWPGPSLTPNFSVFTVKETKPWPDLRSVPSGCRPARMSGQCSRGFPFSLTLVLGRYRFQIATLVRASLIKVSLIFLALYKRIPGHF
jgi:hypothetical protein